MRATPESCLRVNSSASGLYDVVRPVLGVTVNDYLLRKLRNKMMNRSVVNVFWICVLLSLGSQGARANDAVLSVDITKAELAAQKQTLQLTGSIEAVRDADLAVLQAGVVEAFFVDVGDVVEKGDKLLQLDAVLAKLQLQELEATFAVAQVEAREAKRLYDEVLALSKTQFVAETTIAQRRANVALAKGTLNEQQAARDRQREIVKRHTVFAPFTGVIVSRNADIGEWVVPQQSVFNLVSNSNLRIRVAVPQEFFNAFKSRSIEAIVQADDGSASQKILSVSSVVAASDPASRTITTLIDLPANSEFISGMSVTVNFDLGSETDALIWLPETALKVHPDGGGSVFAVINNVAKRIVVQAQKRQGNMVAISGAEPTHDYVVKGVELLHDGMPVTVNTKAGN